MQIQLPDETVRDVQALLAKRGKSGDVSEFIDRTVQRALFFETVREIKRQNAGSDPDELDVLIDEAIRAVRAGRNGTTPHADGA